MLLDILFKWAYLPVVSWLIVCPCACVCFNVFVGAASCPAVVVAGEYAGNYTANGTYRGKMDFFSEDGQFNLYFENAVRRRRALASSVAVVTSPEFHALGEDKGEDEEDLLPAEGIKTMCLFLCNRLRMKSDTSSVAVGFVTDVSLDDTHIRSRRYPLFLPLQNVDVVCLGCLGNM